MPSGRKIGRIGVHIAALTFLVLTVIIIATAIFSNAWQQVDIGTRHDHGLWQYCVNTLDNEGRMCLNMRYGKEKTAGPTDRDIQIHDGQRWRQNTLVVYAVACVCAIISTIVGFFAIRWRCVGILWLAFTFLTFVLVAGAIIQFTINAHDENEMVIRVAGLTFYQHLGWSYVLGCLSTGFAAISFILSAAATGLSFVPDGDKSSSITITETAYRPR